MIRLIKEDILFTSSIILFILSSCVTQKHIDEYKAVYVLDFVPFTERGFLITSEAYQGEYESIGFIEYHFAPEQNLMTVQDGQSNIMGDVGNPYKTIVAEEYNINDGLEEVYKIATNMGANAIMNFRLEDMEIKGTKVEGYIIKGFAIYKKP